ncbi:MAG: polyprenol monophosphomannose synthase [Bacteroidetes bacterium]|nr:polyprenol monophosphomannose synthase [Bacteroidota bacterium]
MASSIVIIPTYNETDNVESMTRAILNQGVNCHILFIDDNSPDGTAKKIESLQKEFEGRVFLEKRIAKLGLGTAYIHGFKYCLARGYTHIFEMDCDFSHNPCDLIRLKEACDNGADLAIGSRYCKGGKIENWPFSRWLISYFASVYVRIILWIKIKDTTAGFKCYRREVLESIKLNNIPFKGYAFQICMKYASKKNGFKLKEIPITFVDRQFGESKMSTKIFSEAFFGVWKMKKMNL